MNNYIFEKTIKKSINKLAKEAADKPVLSTISITKMCDTINHPEYYLQIRNRILRELEQDQTIGDYL